MFTLVNAATQTGAVAASVPNGRGPKTFHAVLTGTGAISCTVKVQGSNNGSNWLDVATVTLSGTTTAQDGFASNAPWIYWRADVTAISGTGASLTVTAGEL